jgi:hypothetical protein
MTHFATDFKIISKIKLLERTNFLIKIGQLILSLKNILI